VTELWLEEAVGIVGGEPKCCKSFLALDLPWRWPPAPHCRISSVEDQAISWVGTAQFPEFRTT